MTSRQVDSDSAAIARGLVRLGALALAAAPYLIGAACVGFAAWFVVDHVF